MIKRQEEKNNNVEEEKLKILAKTFVTAAIKEGLTATRIHKLVRGVWNELMDEVEPKLLLQEESQEEQSFRRKAIRLLEKKPEIKKRCRYNLEYVENGEKKGTNAALELICAMNRVFILDSIQVPTREYIKSLAKQRLKAIGGRKYPAETEMDRAFIKITYFYEEILKRYWNEGLKEFCEQYYSPPNSISEEILTIVWYVEKYC